MKRVVLGGVAMLILGLSACSSDDSGGPSTGTGGGSGGDGVGAAASGGTAAGGTMGGDGMVPTDKPLADLTEEEARAICEADLAPTADIGVGTCTLLGALHGEGETECEALRDACVADLPTGCDAEFDPTVFDGCILPVGEFQACWRELAAVMRTASCVEGAPLPDPPACATAAAERCPLFAQ